MIKIIEVISDAGYVDTILSIAEQYNTIDIWHYANVDDKHIIRLLVAGESTQKVLDSIQKLSTDASGLRLVVLPVEATIPHDESLEAVVNKSRTSRESLYHEVSNNTRLDKNYILLVVLSTIVAALGMLENNVAVVIGAMVIAPLLSPNIALALGTVLGNNKLMLRAVVTFVVGISIALLISFLLSYVYPLAPLSEQLLTRTNVSYSAIAMALASGAAAALSMTTGLSSVLVGVMVAVAILPPVATLGLMLGYQHYELAFGAFLLLSINVVCINLSAIIVFMTKSIRPRTTGEKQLARKMMLIYLAMWIVFLGILIYVINDASNVNLIPPN
jgi:uncharacterized hydrophobic protein (TIGR00341 family)